VRERTCVRPFKEQGKFYTHLKNSQAKNGPRSALAQNDGPEHNQTHNL